MGSTLRMAIGLPLSLVITYFLFLAMTLLIKQDIKLEAKKEIVKFSIIPQILETMNPSPPKIISPNIDKAPPSPKINIDINPVPTDGIKIVPFLPKIAPDKIIQPNKEYHPLVRIAPQYPDRCQSRAAETEIVRVRFDVTTEGSVVNVQAIDATSSCFNRAAIRSVEKWKYSPKLIDGKAVPIRGLETNIIFNLAK